MSSPDLSTLPTPKQRTPAGGYREVQWYPYYAGYTESFVRNLIQALRTPSTTSLLDPWNGSGTTTLVGAEQGLQTLGIDANPALIIVAKGRLLSTNVLPSIDPLRRDLLTHWTRHRSEESLNSDPLLTWLQPNTVAAFRSLENTIRNTLVEPTPSLVFKKLDATQVSSLAALFYVSLFGVLRHLLQPLRSSNPTWMRRPRNDSERISAPMHTIEAAFSACLADLVTYLAQEGLTSNASNHADVQLADSRALAIPDYRTDLIITSPPYCTRIDYVISTLPELAILGYSKDDVRTLRDTMLGTPTIRTSPTTPVPERWGPLAQSTLRSITHHPSQSSKTYYRKYYTQFFKDLAASLRSLKSYTAARTRIALVVQSSYYKEIYIDLPEIVKQMSETVGWRFQHQRDFRVPTKGSLNPHTKAYRRHSSAMETVLVFLGPTKNH
jgi:hypothetical protein